MFLLALLNVFREGIKSEDIISLLIGIGIALVFIFLLNHTYKIFRLQVKLDLEKHICFFRKKVGSFSLSKENLEWWGIRRYWSYRAPGSSAQRWRYHFECKLKSGEVFIYPLPANGDVLALKTEDQQYQYYVKNFSDCLQTSPKELNRVNYPSPFMSPKEYSQRFNKALNYEGTDLDNIQKPS